jgi:hypothetical protein
MLSPIAPSSPGAIPVTPVFHEPTVLKALEHPRLWSTSHRLHLAHDADPSEVERWRRAPEGSQEQIWAAHHDEAMRILAMSLQ